MQVCFSLDPDLHEIVQKLAKNHRRSFSNYVNSLVSEHPIVQKALQKKEEKDAKKREAILKNGGNKIKKPKRTKKKTRTRMQWND